ncbi:MAG: hypothetical protein DMF82_24605 [Acidobacteria bacterium]|nr:MAG: hypothetical protein DMF82_24605 [Acidobacteriota bacterium]
MTVEDRTQGGREEYGHGKVQTLLQARRHEQVKGPEGGQAERGQDAAPAVERDAQGEERHRRGQQRQVEHGDGVRLPAEEAPERAVKHREEGAVRAEM